MLIALQVVFGVLCAITLLFEVSHMRKLPVGNLAFREQPVQLAAQISFLVHKTILSQSGGPILDAMEMKQISRLGVKSHILESK